MKTSLTAHFDRVGLLATLRQCGGAVSEIDATRLRCDFASDEIARDDADKLFEIERMSGKKCGDWTEFFADAIVDHCVWQSRPTGVVNNAQAEWLIERADACQSIGAVAALVGVLTEAHSAPAWLAAAVRSRALAWPAMKSIPIDGATLTRGAVDVPAAKAGQQANRDRNFC